jgi:RNA polymerase sigma factor (sigma-70 family)
MNHYHLMTDKDLVCLFQDGEENAFAELLKRHKDRIFSTIYYLVRERELAEDLFQDSFIRIITNLREKNYNEEGKFIAWAVRVAHNRVIDYFRVQKHMRMVREEEEYSPFDVMPAESRNALEEMIHAEKIMKVRTLIERLPEHQREVVILRHYAGLSFKEISETLKVNINTCLGRMHYAVNEMKEMLNGKTVEEKPEPKKRGPKPKELSLVKHQRKAVEGNGKKK